MNSKTKILALAITGSTVGAAVIAKSVLGIPQFQTVDTGLTIQSSDSVSGGDRKRELELDTFKVQLEQNLVGLMDSLKKLEEQEKLVSDKDARRREQYVQVDHLLACFRDAHHEGKFEGFPRLVFTQSYAKEQIEQMVQKLLERRAELEGEENQSLKQIQQAISQLNARIAETKRHLDNMSVYSALAQAGAHADKSDLVRTALVDCLNTNNKYLATRPSLYENEDTAIAGIPQSDIPSADQFLSQPIPSRTRVASNEQPTVSELTTVLREIVNSRK